MVSIGAGLGVALLVIDFVLGKSGSKHRLHVMPVAVGIYLPFGLAPPILLGGLINHFITRRSAPDDAPVKRGVLITSGLIAGESLVGVFLGFLAYAGVKNLKLADAAATLTAWPSDVQALVVELSSLAALLMVAGWLYRRALKSS